MTCAHHLQMIVHTVAVHGVELPFSDVLLLAVRVRSKAVTSLHSVYHYVMSLCKQEDQIFRLRIMLIA